MKKLIGEGIEVDHETGEAWFDGVKVAENHTYLPSYQEAYRQKLRKVLDQLAAEERDLNKLYRIAQHPKAPVAVKASAKRIISLTERQVKILKQYRDMIVEMFGRVTRTPAGETLND